MLFSLRPLKWSDTQLNAQQADSAVGTYILCGVNGFPSVWFRRVGFYQADEISSGHPDVPTAKAAAEAAYQAEMLRWLSPANPE